MLLSSLCSLLFITLCLQLSNSVPVHSRNGVIVPGFDSSVNIAGGHPTTIEKHPYQVAVLTKGRLIGAGIIIDKRIIVTLASLIHEIPVDDHFTVYAGSTDYTKGIRYDVARTASHDKFNVTTLGNDVAVLYLAKEIKFSNKVKKISIATKSLPAGRSGTVSGWGSNKEANNVVYKEAKQNIFSYKECRKTLKEFDITNSMICGSTIGVSPCWSDFGDVLVSQGKAYGIFSWARSCDVTTDNPSVYTNLVAERHWIHAKQVAFYENVDLIEDEEPEDIDVPSMDDGYIHVIHRRNAILDDDDDETDDAVDTAIEEEEAEEALAAEEEKEQEAEEDEAEKEALEMAEVADRDDEMNAGINDEEIDEAEALEEEQEAQEAVEEAEAIEIAEESENNGGELNNELDRNTEDELNEEGVFHSIEN